jgi:TonB family protein
VRRGLHVLLFSLSLLLSMTFSPSCTHQAAKHPVIEVPDSIEFDIPPEQIYKASVIYPKEAESQGVEGTVWIKCLVEETGAIGDILVLKNSGTNVGFEQAAVDASWKNDFKPALKDGKPVAVWIIFKVEFKLK